MVNPFSNRPANEDSESTIFDLLTLPPERQRVMNWMQRQENFTLTDLAQFLGQSREQVSDVLEEFLQENLICPTNAQPEPCYQVVLGSTHRQRHRGLSSSVFDALLDDGS
jgi:hypothetical protein